MKRPFFTMLLGVAIIIVAAAGPIAAQSRMELESALSQARELIAQGNARQTALEQTRAAMKQESEWLKVIESVVRDAQANASTLDIRDIDGLPGVVSEVKKQTAALQAGIQSLRNIQAEVGAASGATEGVATRVCELAQKSAGAEEDQVKGWHAEATSLISQANDRLNSAQEKVETAGSSEELQGAVEALRSYETHLRILKLGDRNAIELEHTINGQWESAQAAAQTSQEASSKLKGIMVELQEIPQKVRSLLGPFATKKEAATLIAQAESFARIDEPKREDSAERLKEARSQLDAIIAAAKKLERLSADTDVESVIAAADDTLRLHKEILAAARSAAESPERYSALQRASKCLADIRFKGPAEGGEVVVPNLSVFQSVTEMKAALAHAGLVAAVVAAKNQAPSKEKEFKFAGQDPAPDTKVKRGSTVSLAFYQKFDPPDDIVGHWVGTLFWTKKESDPLAIDILRQGDGYVLTSKVTGSKAVPAIYSGGKLTAVSAGTAKSSGVVVAVTTHWELTRTGETLTGTMTIRAADGSSGSPMTVSLTRQSK